MLLHFLLHIECYAGSGTSILGKALETSQGTQAKQKTAGRRRLGNGRNERHNVILSIRAYQTLQICLSSETTEAAQHGGGFGCDRIIATHGDGVSSRSEERRVGKEC